MIQSITRRYTQHALAMLGLLGLFTLSMGGVAQLTIKWPRTLPRALSNLSIVVSTMGTSGVPFVL